MKGIPSWDFNVTFCIVSFKIISTPLFQLQAHVQFQGFNFSLHVRLCEFPRLPDDVFYLILFTLRQPSLRTLIHSAHLPVCLRISVVPTSLHPPTCSIVMTMILLLLTATDAPLATPHSPGRLIFIFFLRMSVGLIVVTYSLNFVV